MVVFDLCCPDTLETSFSQCDHTLLVIRICLELLYPPAKFTNKAKLNVANTSFEVQVKVMSDKYIAILYKSP